MRDLTTISVSIIGERYFCIATSMAKGIAYFAISGRLVSGVVGAVASLHDTISRAIQRDTREIIIDLGGIEQIDAAGIGELVFNYTTACAAGMTLVLENPSPRVKKLLEVCQLDDFLLQKRSEVEDAYVAAAQ